MKLKWKDIYNDNIKRKYCEIINVKQKDVELKSDSLKLFKQKPYFITITILLFTLILLYTFRRDLKVFLLVLGFFLLAGCMFFFFNNFIIKTTQQGLYVRFGLQQGTFYYEKIKSIYLSKYNDYSFLLPSNSYNIVIRYIDNTNKIKELFFSTIFLNKQETIKFLENFEIKEIENERYVKYEKYKMLKRIGKIVAIIALLVTLLIIGYASR